MEGHFGSLGWNKPCKAPIVRWYDSFLLHNKKYLLFMEIRGYLSKIKYEYVTNNS